MPEILVFILVVTVIAVVGVRFGMLLAPRIDRRIAGPDDDDPIHQEGRTG